jgi:transposase
VITFGHSKDHRPDLKQLVWILTVAADGAVPIAYRLADGNTTDDPTHVPTWDQLVEMLGHADFLYIADSKLCSREAMSHIAAAGGRFITVLPHSRGEDRWFRDWAQTHPPQWTEAERSPGPRLGEPDQVYSTFPAPLPSVEGYRIVWVHSTAKAARDAATRQARIEAGAAAIDALATRLAGPKCRLKTRVAVQDEAAAALARAGAERWISYTIEETVEETYRQEHRGRPGNNTRYRRHTTTRHTISWDTRLDVLAYDAATDGCFPLITNDTALTDAQVLAAYRYQPNLERRHHLLKSVQDAAPLLLRNPARIEALFCCQFLALLLAALIERQIRAAMIAAATRDIPLYPELRGCTAPSTERILEIFADLTRHELHRDGCLVQTFEPEINPLQHQVLELLGVPTTAYTDH